MLIESAWLVPLFQDMSKAFSDVRLDLTYPGIVFRPGHGAIVLSLINHGLLQCSIQTIVKVVANFAAVVIRHQVNEPGCNLKLLRAVDTQPVSQSAV